MDMNVQMWIRDATAARLSLLIPSAARRVAVLLSRADLVIRCRSAETVAFPRYEHCFANFECSNHGTKMHGVRYEYETV